MKIRAGFVSNSSSSSFVIFGVEFGRDELADFFKLSSHEEFEGVNERDLNGEVLKKLSEAVGKKLDIHIDGDEEAYSINSIYIGRDPKKLPEDKSLKELKAQVLSEVLKTLGKGAASQFHGRSVEFSCGEESQHIWPNEVDR